ncbi:MAG: aminopeptidase P family protein [Rhizobiaceae bacterium]|jgi:Xaa-Pro dipeptidase|nr:aminopeptidase P family protein [Rhizobiaceae bacterium]
MTSPDITSVQAVLNSSKLDAIAFVPGANFRRIMGTDFHLMERPLVIIVPAAGEAVAIVPNLEMEGFVTTGFAGKIFDWRDEDGYSDAFRDAAQALPQLNGSNRFGLEAQRMRAFEHMALATVFPDTRFVDAHSDLSSIRLHKTDRDIALLKEAIRISETALEATLENVKPGQTELEIKGMLMSNLFANGAEGLAFDPIVAAAGNSAQPHAESRPGYKLQRGDALLIDFGGSFQGFHADITRTFFMGEVSDYNRRFYETVLAANEKGRSVSKAGVSAHAVDDAVQIVLEQSEFSGYRVHKTGHGLGLDVHEAPQIMRGNHQELEAGMVFTIEPGLYRSGEAGVRIEDDVLVTANGIECLTSFPRDLRIIG